MFLKSHSSSRQRWMVASFSIWTRFTAKFKLIFILTQENTFSYRFDFKANRKSTGSSTKKKKKTVLGIFKLALRLIDRHVFMWQSVEILKVFDTLPWKKIFWKTQTVFKKLEYRFLVIRLKTQHFHTKLLSQKPVLRQIEWGAQNATVAKKRTFASNCFIFSKILFQFKNLA